jgi:hypothetical protein
VGEQPGGETLVVVKLFSPGSMPDIGRGHTGNESLHRVLNSSANRGNR